MRAALENGNSLLNKFEELICRTSIKGSGANEYCNGVWSFVLLHFESVSNVQLRLVSFTRLMNINVGMAGSMEISYLVYVGLSYSFT